MATPFASGLYPTLFGLRELGIERSPLENRPGKKALLLFQRNLNLFNDGV